MQSMSYLKCCTEEIMSPQPQVCDKTWDDYYPDSTIDQAMKDEINQVKRKNIFFK